MKALIDRRLCYPVRVYKNDDAEYGDPWLFFLAIDPIDDTTCELIGWTGKMGVGVARACHKLMLAEGYTRMKSTHYENGQARVKYLDLVKNHERK